MNTELTCAELKYLRNLMIDDLSKKKQNQTAGWENLYQKLLEISTQQEAKEQTVNYLKFQPRCY